ncbi:MAG: thermonuclease family protein, partial [Bacteroidaceae bacterium]|nr:thermonuclease family protein [Bacteroidaceae bacterium]
MKGADKNMFRRIKRLICAVFVVLLIGGYFVFPDVYITAKDKAITFAKDFITAIKSPDKDLSFQGLSRDLDEVAKSIEEVAVPAGQKIGEIAEQTSEFISDKVDSFTKSAGEAKDKASSLVKAKLAKVVDGDTIRVVIDGTEVKVRLLSINAEESVHSDTSRNNEYGKAASDWLKDKMKDSEYVWLEYDEEKQDQYGRELCYVWLNDDVDTESEEDIEKYMLNAILLKEGYVYVAIYKPN